MTRHVPEIKIHLASKFELKRISELTEVTSKIDWHIPSAMFAFDLQTIYVSNIFHICGTRPHCIHCYLK